MTPSRRDAQLLLQRARSQWWMVLLLTIVGSAAGVVTALVLPSYYRSGAAFQAETPPPSGLAGSLAGLAPQLASIQLPGASSAQLMSDLLRTDVVLGRVARARYPWKGDTISLTTILGLSSKRPEEREYYAVRRLRSAMSVGVAYRTGVVTFTVEAPTKALALALAESTLTALNEANLLLRQARAGAERRFTAGRAAAAHQELEEAEATLATFYQHNRVLSNSPSLQMTEARLRRALDMAQQVYVQLRIQEEQAALQEVRNTPAIAVIDPPMLPVKRSWPNRRLVVLLGMMVGLAVALVRLQLIEDQDE